MEIGSSIGSYLDRIPDVSDRFEFVEMSLGEGEIPVPDVDPDRVRSDLDAADLDLAVHLPFRQPLATPVDRFDRANREHLAELLDFSADLGARTAVVHVTGRSHGWDREEFARERIAPAMEAVDAAGRERGVEVCFENVGNVGGTPLELVGDLADRTDASLCLDVGHAYEERGQDAIAEFLDRWGDRVSHLHVHDVRDRGDSHIPVGSGEVDYEAVADALRDAGFDGTVTVEVFTDDADYLELSAEKFRGAF